MSHLWQDSIDSGCNLLTSNDHVQTVKR